MSSGEPNPASLEDRFGRLERLNKRLARRATVAVIVAILAILFSWLPSPLTLVGRSPRIRAETIWLSGGNEAFVRFEAHGYRAFVLDDYGRLMLRRVSDDRSKRAEISVGDQGLVVELSEGEVVRARWTLSTEGEKFEKLGP